MNKATNVTMLGNTMFVEIEMYHDAPPCYQGGEIFNPTPYYIVLERDDNADPANAKYQIRGTRDELCALADTWANHVCRSMNDHHDNHFGADDYVYDYLPDYLYALHNFCVAIKYPAPYNRAHDVCRMTIIPRDTPDNDIPPRIK